jgi:hypothetical protein
MTGILPPEEWRGRSVSMLEMLLFIREQVRKGFMLEIFIGMPAYVLHSTVETLESFIEGMKFMLACHGVQDAEFEEFMSWLREVKQAVPPEGLWAEKLLEDAGGDHRAAIERFLDLAAEFVALKQAARQQ